MIKISVRNISFIIPEEVIIDGHRLYHSENLGRGGNSSVECYIDYSTGEEFAVKVIPLLRRTVNDKNEALRVQRELEVLKKINHNHIIKYFGHSLISIKKLDRNKRTNDEDSLFILMEKADSTLKELICKYEIDYSIYSGQILGLCHALKELHSFAIHRDLKPENILIVDSRWVISDFGLCSLLFEEAEEITHYNKAIGPKYWLSPESLSRYINIEQHRQEIDFSSDIYQMCAVFWFVINRKHPSGLLLEIDFTGPEKLFYPIVTGLQHKKDRRYPTTELFLNTFKKAILETN